MYDKPQNNYVIIHDYGLVTVERKNPEMDSKTVSKNSWDANPDERRRAIIASVASLDMDLFEHLMSDHDTGHEHGLCLWAKQMDEILNFADDCCPWIERITTQISSLIPTERSDATLPLNLHLLRARIDVITGKTQQALEVYYETVKTAKTGSSDYTDAVLGICYCHFTLGNPDKCIEMMGFLSVIQPLVTSTPRFILLQALVDKDPSTRLMKLDMCSSHLPTSSDWSLMLVLTLCKEYERTGNVSKAIELLDSTRQRLLWKSEPVETLIGRLLLRDPRRTDEGISILLDSAQHSAVAAIALSRHYISIGSVSESDSVLCSCSDPTLPSFPHYALWRHRMHLDNPIPTLLAAAKTPPKDSDDVSEWAELCRRIIQVYIESNRIEEGLSTLSTLPFRNYSTETRNFFKAQLLFAGKRYTEALPLVDSPLGLDLKKEILFNLNMKPEYMKLIHRGPEAIADGFLRFGDTNDALAWYKQIDSPSIIVKRKICQTFLLSHDFEKAIEQAELILSDPNIDEDSILFCFSIFQKLDYFEKIEKWYCRLSSSISLKCAQNIVDAYSAAGEDWWVDRAVLVAQETIERHSNVSGRLAILELTETLGLLYMRKKKLDEAIFWLSKCLNDTVNVNVISCLCEALLARGDVERAESVGREASRRFPKNFPLPCSWSLSSIPSETLLEYFISLPPTDWRTVSVLVENRRLGRITISLPDISEIFSCIQEFDVSTVLKYPILVRFVCGLIWMVEGKIRRNIDWLNENCHGWKMIDPQSSSYLLETVSNKSRDWSRKILFRNCLEFLIYELEMVMNDGENVETLTEQDRGCVIAWKLLGQEYDAGDEVRYTAWAEYLRLGGNDPVIVVGMGKYYYKSRRYMEVLELCQKGGTIMSELKTEYEQSKIKLFRG